MEQGLLAKYISVAMAATLKFFAGPVAGFALGLNWIETAVCSVAGMMCTVLVVSYVGGKLKSLIGSRRKKPVRRFSRTSRMAVRIWLRFGIVGIAFLTPLLFTPPGGSVLALAFRVPKPQVITWMLISGTIWGLLFSFLIHKLAFLQAMFA